jgi:hypothetical protein
MGWMYQRAYIAEWGLPFSAFSYSPYELMIASTATLLWATVPALILLAATIARTMFVPNPHRLFWRAWLIMASGLAASGALVWLATDYTALGLSLVWASAVALGVIAVQQALPATRRSSERVAAGMLLSLLFFMILVLVAPAALGRYDAQQDRKHLDHLPRVELALRRSLGIDGEHFVGTQLVSGPWRLVDANQGQLWLTPDAQSNQVTEVSAGDVAALTYLTDH